MNKDSVVAKSDWQWNREQHRAQCQVEQERARLEAGPEPQEEILDRESQGAEAQNAEASKDNHNSQERAAAPRRKHKVTPMEWMPAPRIGYRDRIDKLIQNLDNESIANNGENVILPSLQWMGIKTPMPKKYDRNPSPDVLEEWIASMIRYFRLYGLIKKSNDLIMVNLIGMCLSDTAAEWFRSTVEWDTGAWSPPKVLDRIRDGSYMNLSCTKQLTGSMPSPKERWTPNSCTRSLLSWLNKGWSPLHHMISWGDIMRQCDLASMQSWPTKGTCQRAHCALWSCLGGKPQWHRMLFGTLKQPTKSKNSWTLKVIQQGMRTGAVVESEIERVVIRKMMTPVTKESLVEARQNMQSIRIRKTQNQRRMHLISLVSIATRRVIMPMNAQYPRYKLTLFVSLPTLDQK
jgi:hypothetical protein